MMNSKARRLLIAGLAGLLLAGGCVSEEKKTANAANGNIPQVPAQDKSKTAANMLDDYFGKKATPEKSVNADLCSTRLHDIAGALLLYFATNRTMPARLGDLTAAAGAAKLELTCPDTGQPYMYEPNGLRAPGRSKIILVADSVPHNGTRWCILASEAQAGGNRAVEVLPVPEPLFRTYVSGGQ